MNILLDIFILLFSQNFLMTVFLSLLSSTKASSAIFLKINGQGVKNIINDTFRYIPSQVFVNGKLNETCKKSCYLDNIGDAKMILIILIIEFIVIMLH